MRWMLVTLVACGSSSTLVAPPPPASPAGPQLLGRPVADAPLAGELERTAFARAAASLAEGSPNLEGDADTWGASLRTWVERRGTILRELDDALRALPEADRKALFANVVSSVAIDDFVEDLVTLPLPPSVKSEAYAADVEATFRAKLDEMAAPLATAARRRFEQCSKVAPAASAALRVWAEHCRTRAAALAALEQRVASRPAPKRRPVSAKDCIGSEKIEPEPDGVPPDVKAKPRALVLYDDRFGKHVTGADRDNLIAAVTKKLATTTKLALLSAKERAAAEALVAAKRLTPKGPVCGQPPRLTQVLAAKYRNLIIATIDTDCVVYLDKRPAECGLGVRFRRAGTRDDAGLPQRLFAPVARADSPAAEWIAAASKLSTDDPRAAVLGGLLGNESAPHLLSLKDYGDDDPWMRLGEVLRTDTEAKLAACVDAPASFDVKLTISPTGAPTAVALTPVTAPRAGTKVEACVREALEATGFPCTHDGKPVEVAFRACVAPKS